LLLAAVAMAPLHAETLKVAIGQRGNWDTAVSELGQQAGIFAKHGLTLELLYTSGGGETQQAVLSRSVDIGVAAGTLGVLGAASKGAPLRIIGGETTGAADLYWYVPAASPIKTVQDLAGRTVAFSTTGSSTDSVARMMQAQDKVDFRLTATGGLPATFTQVMSGQIDAGWGAAPFGVEALANGSIRIVFRGSDVKAAEAQTVRSLITHAAVLAQKKSAVDRYMQAYRETLDWMYSSPDAIARFAAFAGVASEVALRTRDEFFPKAALDPDKLSGLAAIMDDGVRFKFLAAPLTAQQVSQVVLIEGFKP
jgi:NitT/TauT family transport system substrate-binding protein